ncbi:MAG TPA: 3-deoxy-7-phosphoheptulonate synthase, partial [Gammaproteobacteria bacterium]|nr:3-deoxy-7-phosphoheptulonate synthase [Gammaproteobacteria bacterium]
LVGGRQELTPDKPLVYGQSITDACIDWATSVGVLDRLAGAVRGRRRGRSGRSGGLTAARFHR